MPTPSPIGIVRSLLASATPLPSAPVRPVIAGAVYGRQYGRVRPRADVFIPQGAGPHPAVVLFHGGGFTIGHRSMKAMRVLSTRLVHAGFAVVVFDYPKILRGGSVESMLASSDELVAWWVRRAPELGVDTASMSAIGLSAGSTLMMLYANEHPSAFARLVGYFGVTDFGDLTGAPSALMRRLLFGARSQDQWQRRSPVHHRLESELLLLHGTADSLVPADHSVRLADARRAAGLPVELELYEGIPHGFLNHNGLPAASAALERTVEFLRR